MPIYVVRWPDLSASLVRAHDEEDLLDILDQVANPDGCQWSVYEGPLFIDFRLPVEWSVRDGLPEQPILRDQVIGRQAARSAAGASTAGGGSTGEVRPVSGWFGSGRRRGGACGAGVSL